MKCFLSALLLILVVSNQDGVREFNEGHFRKSYELSGSLSRDPEFADQGAVHFNHALAALSVGELGESRVALELSCAWGGLRFETIRTFLLGNIAFAHCEKMEKLSQRVEAGLPAHDSAITWANSAIAHWAEALNEKKHWPEAIRNIERAKRKLQILERSRQEFMDKSKKKSGAQERQIPEQSEDRTRNQRKFYEEVTPGELGQLAGRNLEDLLKRLRGKEAQKKRKRMQRRFQRSAVSGERDW